MGSGCAAEQGVPLLLAGLKLNVTILWRHPHEVQNGRGGRGVIERSWFLYFLTECANVKSCFGKLVSYATGGLCSGTSCLCSEQGVRVTRVVHDSHYLHSLADRQVSIILALGVGAGGSRGCWST